jgi:hypothetical protein
LTEPFTVIKYGNAMPISDELAAESRQTATAVERWMNATPAERDRWRAEAERERAEVREATPPTPLTFDALCERLGWSREYAEHLVQPYCECGDDIDGWSYCVHAQDLGLAA